MGVEKHTNLLCFKYINIYRYMCSTCVNTKFVLKHYDFLIMIHVLSTTPISNPSKLIRNAAKGCKGSNYPKYIWYKYTIIVDLSYWRFWRLNSIWFSTRYLFEFTFSGLPLLSKSQNKLILCCEGRYLGVNLFRNLALVSSKHNKFYASSTLILFTHANEIIGLVFFFSFEKQYKKKK